MIHRPAGSRSVVHGIGFSAVFAVALFGALFSFSFADAQTIPFSAGTNFNAPAVRPFHMAKGDFNEDGKLDFVVTLDTVNAKVYLGDGSGAFGAGPLLNSSGNGVRAVTVADYNNDTHLDIVLANSDQSTVKAFFGNGAGSFTDGPIISTSVNPRGLASADMNEDGNTDIVAASITGNAIDIISGDGLGGFGAAVSFPVGSRAERLRVGDFNSDNNLDVIVTGPSTKLLLGDGAGNLGAATVVAGNFFDVEIGDFNGDTNLDVALGDPGVNILFGNGAGSFGAPVAIATGSNDGLAVSDLDNDADLDIVASDFNGSVIVLVNDGVGGFTLDSTLPTVLGVLPIITGDFISDGFDEIIVGHILAPNDRRITVFKNIAGPNTPPTITLLGDETITIPEQSVYNDPGFTAFDVQDGDITGSVVVDGLVNTFLAGTYVVVYNVTDSGGLEAPEMTRTVIVEDAEFAPVLDPIGDKSVAENEWLEFAVTASDLDTDDIVTLSASNLPAGATFNPATGIFFWIPTNADIGTYPGVTFTATDNSDPALSDAEEITITVTSAAPVEITAAADSFLRHGNPDRNEGANPMLRIQASGDNRAVVGFDVSEISSVGSISQAILVLTIAENADNWGPAGDRTVDAHALTAAFAEGNGQNAGVPGSQSTRGTGEGVTWDCAIDSNIANQQTNCDPTWNGGSFSAATAPSQLHVNGQTGEVQWDVTEDVLNGTSGWLIKKTNENVSGHVDYYSREGAIAAGHPEYAPRLILTPDSAEIVRFDSSDTWVAPEGVTSVTIHMWGGGGGGAHGGGTGGGAGAYVTQTVPVVAGTGYAVTVAAGGNGATISGPGVGGSGFAQGGTGSTGATVPTTKGGGGGGSSAFVYEGGTLIAAGGAGGGWNNATTRSCANGGSAGSVEEWNFPEKYGQGGGGAAATNGGDASSEGIGGVGGTGGTLCTGISGLDLTSNGGGSAAGASGDGHDSITTAYGTGYGGNGSGGAPGGLGHSGELAGPINGHTGAPGVGFDSGGGGGTGIGVDTTGGNGGTPGAGGGGEANTSTQSGNGGGGRVMLVW